jgi:hypothetical protein
MVTFLNLKSPANDNMDMWTQGYSDGWSDRWSEHLANRNGCLGTVYVAGWLTGNEATLSDSVTIPNSH